MALSPEEVEEVKAQLFSQIENLPEEQQQNARQQIESMNPEQLEEFLVKNKLIKEKECIFCSIVKEETPSYKIAENEEAIAILDINPVSEGHTLIIPKEHKPVESNPSTLQLAKEVSKILKEKLKAENIKIENANVQGHGIINVIPIYKNKKLERKKAEDKELYDLQEKLKQEKKENVEQPEKEVKESRFEDLPKAPRRIP